MPSQIELVAAFLSERHVFENPADERRVIIGTAELRQDPSGRRREITIKGEACERQLRHGVEYRFYGHWHNHHRYGDQFVFSDFTIEEPISEEAVVAYLQTCKGIGPKAAQKLWDRYGTEAIQQLRSDPEAVAQACKLKPEVTHAAAELLKASQGVERTKAELLSLLKGRGFPKKTAENAMKRWGSDAPRIIRNSPHRLMALRGCGFLKTDKAYCDLGLPPDRLRRQALCAWHSVASNSEGHTWFPQSLAQNSIARKVGSGKLQPERAMDLAIRSQMLAMVERDGCRWVAEHKHAMGEERIVRAVQAAAKERHHWPAAEVLYEFSMPSDHQVSELSKALAGPIGILAGSPGTGKTWLAGAVIRWLVATHGVECIAACAPTGKAAVRLTESLAAVGVDLTATTIHRLLVVSASEDGFGFAFDRRRPLPYRFVLIDESSMIDTQLMASLFDARGAGTHFLFLGDVHQLAPVGHGAPLRDLIRGGLPCGTLTEIRRNSGRIVQACAEIRDSQQFTPSPAVNLEAGENLMHVESPDATQTADRIRQFLETIQAKGELDPVWDVQILAAKNKGSKLSIRELNKTVKMLLNPRGERAPGNPFGRGDKIINTKNGWFVATDPCDPQANADGKIFAANGEQGEVISVGPGISVVKLRSPDRLINVFHGAGTVAEDDSDDDNDNPDDKVGDDSPQADQATGTGSSWVHGYVITCHRSQGSEWPIVVIAVDDHPGAQRVCSRNWIYTAISRAKKLCVTIGSRSIVGGMCRRNGLQRRTFLAERITEVLTPPPIQLTPEEQLALFAELGEFSESPATEELAHV